jgi:membrane protein
MARDETQEWASEEGRGRHARWPSHIPWEGWKDILWRTKDAISRDRISLVAAGVSFYLLLAIFPALAALVSVYGFFADPATIRDHVAGLAGVLPAAGLDLIETQLERFVQQRPGTLGLAFLVGLGLALWSANNGVQALFTAMNVAYGEEEKRSYPRLILVSLAFTVGALLVVILFMLGIAVVPLVLAVLGLGPVADLAIRLARWPILLVAGGFAIAALKRYGPSRVPAQWRWLTWGSALTVVTWLVAAVAFSWYLANFANYDETYGSLGAAVGLMLWLWLSMLVLLAGAELDSEIELQTAEDTTVGPEKPLGERGAHVADTVGPAAAKRR